jgi:hypothetical protein
LAELTHVEKAEKPSWRNPNQKESMKKHEKLIASHFESIRSLA